MLERWRPGAWWKLPRGMCRQRAGCNPGTAKADGQRASWKLPRGSWRVLRVLSVWSLANGRLECPNKRGLCAGKGQAAMLERWRPGACCAARDVQAKGRLQPWNSKGWRPEGLVAAAARKQCSSWRAVRVLSVWRGLVAGGARDLEGFKSFKRLKPGKRQAWMPQEQRAMTKQVPHLRWSQAPPLPWRRPGSADIYIYINCLHEMFTKIKQKNGWRVHHQGSADSS